MRGWKITVLLSLWMDVSSGMISIQLIPQYPVTRGSVTLRVTRITGRILGFKWFKGPDTSPQYHILSYIPGDSPLLIPGRLYFSRVTPYLDGSLLISDLHITDGGNYTVNVQTDNPQQQASVTLTVYELVTKPKVTASTSHPKENDPFTLTCNTTHAVRILWSRGRAGLSFGTILSADNRTVTFSNVTRTDSGEYRCEDENLVSKSISDPYTVTVSYGPENVQITVPLYVSVGSVMSLTCSADSVPPPNYQWRFSDRDLNIKQNTLNIDHVSPESQGNYTCMVNNLVTLRTATAAVYVTVSMESSPPCTGLSIGSIAGLIIGITLGVALIIIAGFILYRRFVRPERDKQNESSADRHDQCHVYDVVRDKAKYQSSNEDSSYMNLQFRLEETYTELKK